MSQYIVTTPLNPAYSGKTCGVRFERGRAFVSQYTINPALGYSVDEVARKMKEDFGYDVQKVEEEAAVAVETIYAAVPSPAPAAPVDEAPTGGAKKTRGGK